MWRYYAVATVIVLVAGSILFAHRMRTGEWDLRAQPAGTPTVTRGSGAAPPSVADVFVGAGPWVLSALPACFDQQSSIEGPAASLVSHLPPPGTRIPDGTTLHAGPCTVVVRAHDLLVSRGRDRLRVPPDAGLYRTAKGLVLVYERSDHAEIRVYHDARPPGAHK